jgi:hypothetical protein
LLREALCGPLHDRESLDFNRSGGGAYYELKRRRENRILQATSSSRRNTGSKTFSKGRNPGI